MAAARRPLAARLALTPVVMLAAARSCAAAPRCLRAAPAFAQQMAPVLGLHGPAGALWRGGRGTCTAAPRFGARGFAQRVPPRARAVARTVARMAAAGAEEDTGLWADAGTTFEGLGLGAELADALGQLGFSRPTRIQAAALPAILAGKDVVMGAETGSGKTLAYVLPALQRVLGEREAWDKRPEVLVLVPNQELARQVTAVIASIARANAELAAPVAMLAGSAGLSREASCAMLVATPSAILRNTEPTYLDQVHTAIVDEADMLLDGGFVADVTRILDFLCPRVSNSAMRRLSKEGKTLEDGQAELPRQPAQVLFAAATLPDWKGDKVKSVVRTLRKRFPDAENIATEQLHKQSRAASHDWIDLGRGASQDDTHAALLELLRGERRGLRTMVFCNTVRDATTAHEFLREEGLHSALLLHKEVPPGERAAALAKLASLPSLDAEAIENGEWVLVCTDIAARYIILKSVLASVFVRHMCRTRTLRETQEIQPPAVASYTTGVGILHNSRNPRQQ